MNSEVLKQMAAVRKRTRTGKKPMSAEKMKELAVAEHAALRKWAAEHSYGTKPATEFTKWVGRGLEQRLVVPRGMTVTTITEWGRAQRQNATFHNRLPSLKGLVV